LGYKVAYLKRVQHGSLGLGSLAKGKWRRLTDDEVRRLKENATMKA